MGWSGAYINLDRSPQRRLDIEQEIARLGLADRYRRFAAIDGATLAEPPATAGVRGCYESHLAILRGHAGSSEWLHIVEDDAVFSRFAGAGIDAVAADSAWSRFDIVFTNVRLMVPPATTSYACNLFDKATRLEPDGRVADLKTVFSLQLGSYDFLLTTSYLVNGASCGRIVDHLVDAMAKSPAPIDHLYCRLAKAGALTMAVTIPYLTLPRMQSVSTIRQANAEERLFHLMDAPLFADRDVGELESVIAELNALSRASPTTDLAAAAYRAFLGATQQP